MSEIVCTGSSGFICSHLVEALHIVRKRILCVDKKFPHRYIKNVVYQTADISKPKFKLDRKDTDILYHLAARPWCMTKGADGWFNESQRDFYTNALGTYNILVQANPKLTVFSSTSSLYGNGHKFKETGPLRISNPYAYSKAVAERIISESGKNYVIYRFGSVIGIRGRVFPNRLVWCAVNKVPVEVFNQGNNYRDLIDVRDVVSALMVAPKLDNGIYNISSGMEINSRELAMLISEVANGRGHRLDYKFVDFQLPGLVPNSTLDISKILDSKVWAPKISLESSIEALFEYYEKPEAIEPPRWDHVN